MNRSHLPFNYGQYIFTEQIGHGGFSEVFLVTHRTFNKQFVAKAMSFDQNEAESSWELFEAEVKALSGLNHPNIIFLYDHFKNGNTFYLVLEYCPNGSLHDISMGNGGLRVNYFYDLALQIVDALAYCHRNGIAHRDIKPGNVLLDEYYRAKIADFGLCRKTNMEELTENFGGSLSFLAPEIFQKKPHNAMMADVWALGVTFAAILMGRSPWNSDSLGGLKKLISTAKFRLSRRIPDVLQDLIRKMIVVDPNERLTMDEILKHPFFTQTNQIPKNMNNINLINSLNFEKNSKSQITYNIDNYFAQLHFTKMNINQRYKKPENKELDDADDIISFV